MIEKFALCLLTFLIWALVSFSVLFYISKLNLIKGDIPPSYSKTIDIKESNINYAAIDYGKILIGPKNKTETIKLEKALPLNLKVVGFFCISDNCQFSFFDGEQYFLVKTIEAIVHKSKVYWAKEYDERNVNIEIDSESFWFPLS